MKAAQKDSHRAAMTIATSLVLLLVLLAPIAKAHTPENWFYAQWNAPVLGGPALVQYGFAPSFPSSSAWETRVNNGSSVWTNRSAGDLTFQSTGDLATEPDRDPCRTTTDPNSVHYAYIDGNSGTNTLAATAVCYSTATSAAGQGRMLRFSMTYDSGNTFYTGTGQPSSSQVDLYSVASHEFGHAAGGWGAHWDQQGQASLCPTHSGRHTMCSTLEPGTNFMRSLNTHDAHTFETQY